MVNTKLRNQGEFVEPTPALEDVRMKYKKCNITPQHIKGFFGAVLSEKITPKIIKFMKHSGIVLNIIGDTFHFNNRIKLTPNNILKYTANGLGISQKQLQSGVAKECQVVRSGGRIVLVLKDCKGDGIGKIIHKVKKMRLTRKNRK